MKIAKNIVKTRIDFVRRRFGEEGWARVLAALPPDDQKELRGIIATVGWFPFELGARLDEAIVRVLGEGRTEVFEAIGGNSARENLATVHRPFLAPGNPRKFLKKADSIYKYYYDTGHRPYEPAGESEGILTPAGRRPSPRWTASPSSAGTRRRSRCAGRRPWRSGRRSAGRAAAPSAATASAGRCSPPAGPPRAPCATIVP